MKKYLAVICCAWLLQACKKEGTDFAKVLIPEVPAQETAAPAGGTTTATGSIIYTEIDQELAYNKFIALDVDRNGKNDFYFTSVLIYHGGQSHLYLLAGAVSANGGKLLLDQGEELVMNGLWAKTLDAGTGIKTAPPLNAGWNNFMIKGVLLDVIQNGNADHFNGPWVNKISKYLGMQVTINGKVHYGWIRISHLSGEARMIISGYAYNAVAEAAISAGQISGL